MKEYDKLLFILSENEKYTETYLIRKSSKLAVVQALEDGMLCEIGKTDVGIPTYALTAKGKKNR